MWKFNTRLLSIISTLVLMTGCKNEMTAANDKTGFSLSDSLLETLQITPAIKCPVVNTLTLTGKVTFDEDEVVRIFPMVSGNISGITVQTGDYVNKSQVMGCITSGEMAGYSNEVVSTKTNLLIARKNLDASEDLYKSGLLSEKDYVTSRELYRQSVAASDKAEEILRINGGNMHGKYFIKTPINGFVVSRDVNNNMAIRADNSNSLFTISDLKKVWVIANLYESGIGQVHTGDSVYVTTLAYPGKIFYGRVNQVFNVLDPDNKVMKVKIVIPNTGYLLKPEMFASVMVINKTDAEALCIPSSALVFDKSRYFVLVYKSKKEVTPVPVSIISSHAGQSYISSNIQPGDKVIASDAVLIYNELNN